MSKTEQNPCPDCRRWVTWEWLVDTHGRYLSCRYHYNDATGTFCPGSGTVY